MKKSSDIRAQDPLVLRFSKMHGAGNDFIVIDARYRLPIDVSKLVPDLTDRHFGIGADGVVLIESSTHADFRIVYFNRDGSRAICGNATRCCARFVYDLGILPADTKQLKFETDSGLTTMDIQNRGRLIRADMGRPIFDGKSIPVAEPGEHLNREFRTAAGNVVGSAVSMGNPHLVIFIPDLDAVDPLRLGPLLEVDPFFPERTNVELVQVMDRNTARLRVWERGVGETLACGTGVCGVFAVGMKLGLLDSPAAITTKGGEFQAAMGKESGRIFLAGPVETVFTGEINVSNLLHRGEQSFVAER